MLSLTLVVLWMGESSSEEKLFRPLLRRRSRDRDEDILPVVIPLSEGEESVGVGSGGRKE